jgi:hydroxymethylbilane synthase
MVVGKKIVLGTRGSELARTQTRMVEAALLSLSPALEIEIKEIKTRGDESSEPVDRRAGRKGLFTGEIERALANDTIDVAVHSAKDLPSELSSNLEIRAVLSRANVEDVLISKREGGCDSLGHNAIVATGSIRRKFQWLWIRPDLEIVDLRGNVPTRLRKFEENENWDAIVLARAGLERLKVDFGKAKFHTTNLSLERFLPAGGQGVIALQTRREDLATNALVDRVNHLETHFCLRAEREFLRLLEGDCDSPVGVLARIDGGRMNISAQVFENGRREPRAAEVTGNAGNPEQLAAFLLEKIHDA